MTWRPAHLVVPGSECAPCAILGGSGPGGVAPVCPFQVFNPAADPSLIKMLDSEVIDSGFTVSDTLLGGVKTR